MPVYAILGRREQGKTTLGYAMSRRVRQRAVFDPRGLFNRHANARIDTLADVRFAFDELAAGTVDEIVFTPGRDLGRGFEVFTRSVHRWSVTHRARPLAVLVDEAGLVPLEDEAFQLVMRTSPRTMALLLTAHRPVDLPVIVRSLADHWVVFASKEPRDLAILSERCSEVMATTVPTLGLREFATWDDRGAGRMRVHRDPAAWFVSLEPEAPAVPLLTFRSPSVRS